MTSFELYIEDERYSVLQLAFVTADSPGAAVEIATEMLRDNPNYRGVELRTDDAWLFSAGTLANTRDTKRDPHADSR